MSKSIVGRTADNIRILSAAMVEKAGSGHPGGAMGGADFITVLFTEFLKFDPDDPAWPLRDRFFLDPGHMSAMLYSILMLTGNYSIDDLKNFRQWGSHTPGHPEIDLKRGIENTSGPLGQGHAMAVGAAIAERFLAARFGEWMAHKTYAYLSDGSVQEEISQGAGRLAGHLGLGNLIMFFDSNKVQLSSQTSEVTSENTAAKYKSWGWHVQTIDGNDEGEIRQALQNAVAEIDRPSIIIGNTTMGFGALSENGEKMEGLVSTHGQPLSKAGVSFEKTVRNLGGDPEVPFATFPDVKKFFSDVLENKRKEVKERLEIYSGWRSSNTELAMSWDNFYSGETPQMDYSKVIRKKDAATRNASGEVLAMFVREIDNMIVISADLSNSDKTEGFLKGTKILEKDDFTGAFLQAGVSELTMAEVASGIALHGGIIVACATFFVFSDFMKPAIRLAALMEVPVKYIFTHDAFRVGEDGPTHQPVEQEAQIRLMEQLKNHSGEDSMLVLRPADYEETIVSWKMAMENHKTPTALILSRQNIKELPGIGNSSRSEEALKAYRGAYVVWEPAKEPDVILIANGSEVSTLYDAAEILEKEKNIRSRVISAPSEGLFRKQDKSYQEQVIPPGIPAFGLTAGLPVTLQGLAGQNGKVFGLTHFGYSAPYKVLDEKFGFTPENIAGEVEKYLKG